MCSSSEHATIKLELRLTFARSRSPLNQSAPRPRLIKPAPLCGRRGAAGEAEHAKPVGRSSSVDARSIARRSAARPAREAASDCTAERAASRAGPRWSGHGDVAPAASPPNAADERASRLAPSSRETAVPTLATVRDKNSSASARTLVAPHGDAKGPSASSRGAKVLQASTEPRVTNGEVSERVWRKERRYEAF